MSKAESQKITDAAREEYLRSCHTLFRNTGNPVHAWDAIHACLEPNARSIPLPPWCAAYLSTVSENIFHLSRGADYRTRPNARSGDAAYHAHVRHRTLAPDQAMKLIPDALALTRKGWNAFAAWEAWMQKEADMEESFELRSRGMTAEQAARIIQERRGLSDTRAARRRIAEALKALPIREDET